MGLVGESGSGKSTLARVAAGLLMPTAGIARVEGIDYQGLKGAARKSQRKRLGMIFQDPRGSLNPRMTVDDIVQAPMTIHGVGTRADRIRRVTQLLDAVRISTRLRTRYPHELSGGQRQRISIARALVLNPAVLIADEPTSALDVSVQASVLELLASLQKELQFGCLFISHDLAVVSQLANRVAVMKDGRIVEHGATDRILFEPKSEYTASLVSAVPSPNPDIQRQRHDNRKTNRGV